MKHAKLLAFGLAAGLTLALGANALAAETKVDQFTDVQNHWAKESIQFVVENDLFNGVSETSFAPNSTMTRGMVTTVLYRLVGSPEVSGESVLDDVPDGLWYSDAVNWAVANNVARGIKTNMFQPNDPVTREDLASMMFGFAKLLQNYTVESGGMAMREYSDYDQISAEDLEGVSFCFYTGIMEGLPNNTLNPQGNATRAEVATMIQRLSSFLAGEPVA